MKISVAICTYNGEKYIEEQLNSIIRQSRSVDEIIVGDDGSSDRTVELINRILSVSGIHYEVIVNEKGLGVAKNFYNVMQKCSGDIIITADQDDYWIQHKVEIIERFFLENKDCHLVFSDAIVTNENLNPIGRLWDAVNFTKAKRRQFKQKQYYKVLLSNNVITGAAMGIRKSLLVRCLPLVKDNDMLHDYWFALNAPIYGHIGMIDTPLLLYRQHGDNVVGVKNNSISMKIGRWIEEAKKGQNDSVLRVKWAESFYAQVINDASKEYAELFDNWIEFNKWRSTLKNKRKFICIVMIIKNKMLGKYNKFYNLKFAALQDIFSCIIR